jgi:lycopene beta-cyclase
MPKKVHSINTNKFNQMMQPTHKIHVYDYVFIGAGASTILLLLSLERNALLENKNILIADPDRKDQNDKTYCFWGNAQEPFVQNIERIVSHRWNSFAVNQSLTDKSNSIEYFHIKGIDLYQELNRIIQKFNITRTYASVNELKENNDHTKVLSENETWLAKMVFDSRPPSFHKPNIHQAHLFQSFVGFVVQLNDAHFNSTTIDLMDFNVPQNENTQFMYVLPFGQNLALVELTRFGENIITVHEAEPIIKNYVEQHYGAFQLIDTEIGCIPMSSAEITTETPSQKIIKIGARAGAIKPSTGYAFKNMINHSETISQSILNNTKIEIIERSPRFQLYDRLLLKIIEKNHTTATSIFETLFQKNPLALILKFLDEKTSIWEDIQIFKTLPFLTFMKALLKDTWHRFYPLMPTFILLITALILNLLFVLDPEICNKTSLILGVAGLFTVGIPHGALDHLLESKQINHKPTFKFIFQYLGVAFLYFLLWVIAPKLSFYFFLFFSIWHFGSTDILEWRVRKNKAFKSWLWGTLVFGIILFGHFNETKDILLNMNVDLSAIKDSTVFYTYWVSIVLAIVFAIIENKKQIFLAVAIILLANQLPLLIAFGIYFIGQHSFTGWTHLKQGLNANNLNLTKKAFPFTFGALFLFAVLTVCIQLNLVSQINNNLLSLFFIFIACISFPHVLAMNMFYKKTSLN